MPCSAKVGSFRFEISDEETRSFILSIQQIKKTIIGIHGRHMTSAYFVCISVKHFFS